MAGLHIHVHFHDGELAKLARFCVGAYTAGFRNIVEKSTAGGKIKEAERRKLQAFEKLATLSCSLTADQREILDSTFRVVEDYQKLLQRPGLTGGAKRHLAKDYLKAVKRYAGVVEITSTSIIKDLEHNKGDAMAFKMAKASTDADYEALEMAKGIRQQYQKGLSEAPKRKHNNKSTQQKSQGTIADKGDQVPDDQVPMVFMGHVADCIEELEDPEAS